MKDFLPNIITFFRLDEHVRRLKVRLDTLETEVGEIPEPEAPSYKVYTALINQEGTDAPTAEVLENTLGSDITWSYSATGTYYGAVTSEIFTADNTYSTITANFDGRTIVGVFDGTQIKLQSLNRSYVNINDALYLDSLEIRVYN